MTTARQAAVGPWTVGTVWNAVCAPLLAWADLLLACAALLLAGARPPGCMCWPRTSSGPRH
jgi:hypothetical protein